jgi:hypothetical protein
MGLTVHLEDTLAEELRQEASDERVSVEELAHRLMRDALQQRLAEKRWRTQNRRRMELIARKMSGTLTPQEQDEFQRLQAVAYQVAAPFDTALLQTVEGLRRQLEQMPEEPAP